MGDHGRGQTFTLMIQEREIRVEIRHKKGTDYDVVLGGAVVGRLRKVRQGRFVCRDKKSGLEFGGVVRQQAVTSMIYDCYPKGKP